MYLRHKRKSVYLQTTHLGHAEATATRCSSCAMLLSVCLSLSESFSHVKVTPAHKSSSFFSLQFYQCECQWDKERHDVLWNRPVVGRTTKLILVEVFFFFFLLFLLQLLSSQLRLWKHSWSGDSGGFWSFEPGADLKEKGIQLILGGQLFCYSVHDEPHHSSVPSTILKTECFFKHTFGYFIIVFCYNCHLHQHLKKTTAQFSIKAPMHNLALRVKMLYTWMIKNIVELLYSRCKVCSGEQQALNELLFVPLCLRRPLVSAFFTVPRMWLITIVQSWPAY